MLQCHLYWFELISRNNPIFTISICEIGCAPKYKISNQFYDVLIFKLMHSMQFDTNSMKTHFPCANDIMPYNLLFHWTDIVGKIHPGNTNELLYPVENWLNILMPGWMALILQQLNKFWMTFSISCFTAANWYNSIFVPVIDLYRIGDKPILKPMKAQFADAIRRY